LGWEVVFVYVDDPTHPARAEVLRSRSKSEPRLEVQGSPHFQRRSGPGTGRPPRTADSKTLRPLERPPLRTV
jgi:hypothetical protein